MGNVGVIWMVLTRLVQWKECQRKWKSPVAVIIINLTKRKVLGYTNQHFENKYWKVFTKVLFQIHGLGLLSMSTMSVAPSSTAAPLSTTVESSSVSPTASATVGATSEQKLLKERRQRICWRTQQHLNFIYLFIGNRFMNKLFKGCFSLAISPVQHLQHLREAVGVVKHNLVQ